jgi:hypothetical protein
MAFHRRAPAGEGVQFAGSAGKEFQSESLALPVAPEATSAGHVRME